MALNERIEFITYETFEDDEGIRHNKESIAYECWAERKNFSNNENVEGKIINKYSITFKVRYCKFSKELEFNTKGYKLKYNNLIFNIVSAVDEDNNRAYITIKVEAKL